MPFQKKYRDQAEDDFTIQGQPKRSSYKKINKKLRWKLVRLAVDSGIPIADLSKRYRINYSTISYIIRAHKEQGHHSSTFSQILKKEVEEPHDDDKVVEKVEDLDDKIGKEEEVRHNQSTLEMAGSEQWKNRCPFMDVQPFLAKPNENQMEVKMYFPFFPFVNYEYF